MYETIAFLGIGLVFAGAIALMAYTFINSAQHAGTGVAGQNQSVKAGGVIILGFIPIVFGNSQGSILIAEALAIVLMIISIILFFLFARK